MRHTAPKALGGHAMSLNRIVLVMLCALSIAVATSSSIAVAQPSSVSYQGELRDAGVPVNGNANFKFAIISSGATLWSNDGTSVAGSEPAASINLPVRNGIFGTRLGALPMVPLTATALSAVSTADLRVWVDTGGGFHQLSDQPLSSA